MGASAVGEGVGVSCARAREAVGAATVGVGESNGEGLMEGLGVEEIDAAGERVVVMKGESVREGGGERETEKEGCGERVVLALRLPVGEVLVEGVRGGGLLAVSDAVGERLPPPGAPERGVGVPRGVAEGE